MIPGPIRLRLPATSANLGPGFDAVGLALALHLTIDAHAAPEPTAPPLTIEATGRDAPLCARTDNNLIFETYRGVLASAARPIVPLHLRVHNEIPLGMGCGSSAAALLGGVLLANHFGALGWSTQQGMEEACRREGHPDNVAASALGYLTVSTVENNPTGDQVLTATLGQHLRWKLLLALPSASLATEKARALLPAQYPRADAVANVQRTALLVSAFALDRPGLLRVAMQDRLHQPYRMDACPLLARLLPLAGQSGILGVALSGAGPSVLLIAAPDADTAALTALIRDAASGPGPELAPSALEVLETRIAPGATQQSL